MKANSKVAFHGATSASSIMGAALMWAWWDLAIYTDVYRNWMAQPQCFSALLFVVSMLAAGAVLYVFARFAQKVAPRLYGATSGLIWIGVVSALASTASIVGAHVGSFSVEVVARVINGGVLGVLVALWGSVAAERGSRSGIVSVSLSISLGAVIDAVVLYATRPLYAAVAVALFPLLSVLVFVHAVRRRVDGEVFARNRSTHVTPRRATGAARHEFYGLSALLLVGLSVAEIAFNFMNYQVVYVGTGPICDVTFNYGCHLARAAGALLCFVFVGVFDVSYKRFFWTGGLLMSAAFATMPFWGMVGIPQNVSNYINMACFAMVVVFVFGVLCEISYERKVSPLEPVGFGAVFITAVDSLGIILGVAVNRLLGASPELVASFASALGYVLILALLGILTEGQRYLDVSTGVAAGRRLQSDDEISAELLHKQRCEKLIEAAGLTARERDILLDVLRDKGLPSIARMLGISENTVKTHVQNIYRKFDVHGRAELMALFAPTQAGACDWAGTLGAVGTSGESGSGTSHKKAALADAIELLARKHGLTRREGEVFALLARGYRHGEIQERLSVSPSTVHTHVTNIYAKMDLHSHAELSKLVQAERARLVGKAGE